MNLKLDIKTLGLILSLAGSAAMFLYARGVKDANKENNNSDLVKTVTEQKESIDYLRLKVEGLDNSMELSNSNLIILVNDVSKMQGSVKSLALKVADSPSEFAKIMEGKTFEVVQEEPMKSIFPSPKIRIQKISKDSVK